MINCFQSLENKITEKLSNMSGGKISDRAGDLWEKLSFGRISYRIGHYLYNSAHYLYNLYNSCSMCRFWPDFACFLAILKLELICEAIRLQAMALQRFRVLVLTE
jgi:hypothetical protein